MKRSVAENILIVGCGDLGGKVATSLNTLNYQVTGLSRSAKPLNGVNMLQADVTFPESLDVLNGLSPSVVIYCVAANGQTDAQYKANYVDGLRNILATQAHNQHLKSVFFVSSTRVYGQASDAVLDENVLPIPNDFGGERLLEAEHLLDSLNCDTTVLRLSGIYGPGRLRMIQLAKSPHRWPEQNGWSNRIHRDDAAAFIVHLVQMRMATQNLKPCYIVTDSKPSTQYEVLNWLAAKLNVSVEVNTPNVAGGKRLSNQAMLATGFKLQYPDYKTGYFTLLKHS